MIVQLKKKDLNNVVELIKDITLDLLVQENEFLQEKVISCFTKKSKIPEENQIEIADSILKFICEDISVSLEECQNFLSESFDVKLEEEREII